MFRKPCRFNLSARGRLSRFSAFVFKVPVFNATHVITRAEGICHLFFESANEPTQIYGRCQTWHKGCATEGIYRYRSRKEYEAKRVRSFQKEWQSGRPWLIFDEAKNVMFCECCKSGGAQGSFTSGSGNFKLDSIKQHESSKIHIKDVVATPAAKCLYQLKAAEFERMSVGSCHC